MTMRVGGIVLNRGWWSVIMAPEVVTLQVQPYAQSESVPPSPAGATSVTPEVIADVDRGSLPDLGREAPQPFIQIGGLPVIFGTAIISHFLASDFGQRLLYGSEEDQMTYEIEHTR